MVYENNQINIILFFLLLAFKNQTMPTISDKGRAMPPSPIRKLAPMPMKQSEKEGKSTISILASQISRHLKLPSMQSVTSTLRLSNTAILPAMNHIAASWPVFTREKDSILIILIC